MVTERRIRLRLPWLLLPVAAGTAARLYGLARQVTSGDELHAVRTAVRLSLPDILTTYMPTDACIPLTALYRMLLVAGGPFTELVLRLPILVSGLAALVVLPRWVARRLDRDTALLFAWLLAVSPLAIYYSRILRSYMPALLLASCAAGAFWDWCATGSRRSALTYALTAAGAVYFHLVAAPFVAAPLAFWAVGRLVRPAAFPSLRRLWLPAGGFAVLSTLLVAPAVPSLLRLVALRQGEGYVGLHTLKGALLLLAGSGHSWVAWLFWGLALVGLAGLLRRRPGLGLYGMTLLLVQATSLWIVAPLAVQQPPIFTRYLLVGLPLALVWTAHGLALLVSGRRLHSVLLQVAGAGLAAGLVWTGPLLEPGLAAGSFAHSAAFTAFWSAGRGRTTSPTLPRGYSRLDRPGALAEYPWHPFWRYTRSIQAYQRIHGRQVVAVTRDEAFADPRVHFRNVLPPRPERLLASRARYFVLHRDPLAEESALDRKTAVGSERTADWERRSKMLTRQARLAARLAGRLRKAWGPADYADETLLIWDLGRLRHDAR